MERRVNIDDKVRTDHNYPAGFMDVLELEKSGDRFLLMFDTKGRFVLHQINREEAAFKLCRIMEAFISANKIPVAATHNGWTIRYPDPDVKVDDTVKIDIASGKVTGSFIQIPNRRRHPKIPKPPKPTEWRLTRSKWMSCNTFKWYPTKPIPARSLPRSPLEKEEDKYHTKTAKPR